MKIFGKCERMRFYLILGGILDRSRANLIHGIFLVTLCLLVMQHMLLFRSMAREWMLRSKIACSLTSFWKSTEIFTRYSYYEVFFCVCMWILLSSSLPLFLPSSLFLFSLFYVNSGYSGIFTTSETCHGWFGRSFTTQLQRNEFSYCKYSVFAQEEVWKGTFLSFLLQWLTFLEFI